MKLIKPSWEIWEQEPGLEGVYKMIEKVGRVCYKSEDKITEDSAKPFVDRLMKSKHGAMLEHGTVYLYDRYDISAMGSWSHSIANKYSNNKYSVVNYDNNGDFRGIYVTTNLRVLVENGWLDDLKYLCEPTEFHEKRITVHFVLDRATAQEFTRHRTFSFAMESQRYCNYSKDKFSNEVTFILPPWANLPEQEYGNRLYPISYKDFTEDLYTRKRNSCFIYSLYAAEDYYFDLLKFGLQPQEARTVLPNATKTELIITGFADESGWLNFFNLRALGTTGAPHPQAKELAKPLFEEFKKRELIK